MEHRIERRNRDGDDQRAAPAPQKQQDHDGGKARGDDGFANHAADGGADEQGLIGDRLYFERGRKRGGDLRQQAAHLLDDVERGGVANLQDAEQRAALAIAADDVGLRRKAVAHVRHVVHVDGAVADGLDRKIVELLNGLGAGIQADVIFELADLRSAGGQNQVLGAHGVHHIGRRQAFGLQQRGLKIDHHLALLSAIGPRDGRALHGGELGADEVGGVIEQLLLGKALAGQRELQDGDAGGAVDQHVGRLRAGRHLMNRVLRHGGHLRHRHVHARAGMEEDLGDAAAVHGLRFHVIDIGDHGGKRALIGRSDALFHFFGAQAGIIPQRGNHRDVDIRENVGRRAQNDQRADEQDQKRHHNERVGALQRDINYPHLAGELLKTRRRFIERSLLALFDYLSSAAGQLRQLWCRVPSALAGASFDVSGLPQGAR